jgi:hypothetical protein
MPISAGKAECYNPKNMFLSPKEVMQDNILRYSSPWISQVHLFPLTQHLEVLAASLPFFFEDEEADEWLHVFEKAVSGIGNAESMLTTKPEISEIETKDRR